MPIPVNAPDQSEEEMIDALLADPLGGEDRRGALKLTKRVSGMKQEYSKQQREAILKTEEGDKQKAAAHTHNSQGGGGNAN